jgi:uncharacterized membrane protein YfcA
LLLLFFAGCIASGLNSFAGGGSLVSFPMLVGLGVGEQVGNATNAVALWPGSLSSSLGFKKYWSDVKADIYRFAIPTFLGSSAGAALLILTPNSVFRAVVPALILVATLLLAFQKKLKTRRSGEVRIVQLPVALALQFAISVYGGYFGAGMGILMLALLGLIAKGDIHRHNAIKNTLGLFINFTASVIFVAKGLVLLVPGLALMAGAIVGGYAAAHMSQKIAADSLRKGIVVYGFVMTAWFAWRAFGG